jgi:hypothetical protein
MLSNPSLLSMLYFMHGGPTGMDLKSVRVLHPNDPEPLDHGGTKRSVQSRLCLLCYQLHRMISAFFLGGGGRLHPLSPPPHTIYQQSSNLAKMTFRYFSGA